ncbi:MAG TPA: hypothetical protein VGD77_13440 [Gemmatimonadaceae bacterium]
MIGFLDTVAAIAFAILLAASAATLVPGMGPGGALVGTGWKSFIGCAGCLGAGSLIVAGGPGAILAALYAPGGAIALGGCVAVCYEAVK